MRKSFLAQKLHTDPAYRELAKFVGYLGIPGGIRAPAVKKN